MPFDHPALLAAEVVLEVPFHDVDSMGLVWHGHYLKYFEIARTALMRKAGLDIDEMARTGCVWPVVTCEIKYIRPLRYGQRFRVDASLQEYEERLKIGYGLWDLETGQRLSRATTVQLPVDARTGELRFGNPPEMVAVIARVLG